MRIKSEATKKKDADRCKAWRESNRELLRKRDREKYLRNIEKYKARSVARAKRCKDLLNAQSAVRRKKKSLETLPARLLARAERRAASKLKRRQYEIEYEKRRSLIDPSYKAGRRLRSRLRNACKKAGAKRGARMMDLLGCSLDFLRDYLAAQFTPGMTWKNHGAWHIDHKRPCASFDLTKESEQRICFHYTNLQPLWGIDNIKKADNVALAA